MSVRLENTAGGGGGGATTTGSLIGSNIVVDVSGSVLSDTTISIPQGVSTVSNVVFATVSANSINISSITAVAIACTYFTATNMTPAVVATGNLIGSNIVVSASGSVLSDTTISIPQDISTVANVVFASASVNNINVSTITAVNVIVTTSISSNAIGGRTVSVSNLSAATITVTDISCNTVTGTYLSGASASYSSLGSLNISTTNISCGTITAVNIACTNISGGNLSGATASFTSLGTLDISASNISCATITVTDIACITVSGGNMSANVLSSTSLASLNVSVTNLSVSTITATSINSATVSSPALHGLNMLTATATVNNIALLLTTSNILQRTVNFIIDGSGDELTTGQCKGYIDIGYAANINRIILMADTTGDIGIDIWKTDYSSFPPTAGNSLWGAGNLTIANGINVTATNGFTASVLKSDVLAFNIDTIATITNCTVVLEMNTTN